MRQLAATLICAAALARPVAAPAQQFYHLAAATRLAGAAPDWDYVTLDPARPYLFIGRRAAGMSVFDTGSQRVIATLAQSRLAGAAALVAEFDRGYTANEDGTSTVFTLSTLKTTARITVGHDNDSVFYDPASRQLLFTQGDSRRLAFVEAATGRVLGALPVDSGKLDAAAPDGTGQMFVAERDRDSVARIDMRTRSLSATWKLAGCHQPTGLAFDRAAQRIFVGCRGDTPVLAVVDAHDGRVVAAKPIGRGNDGVVFDPDTREIYTSNGVDANLVIYRQLGPDDYALAEATTTRPYARTMALDPKTKTVYLVNAEGTANPAIDINAKVATFYPNTYFDGTFAVLAYSRK